MREFLRGDFQSVFILPGGTQVLLSHFQREAPAGEGEHALLSSPIDTTGAVPREMDRGTAHNVSGVGDEPDAFLFAL